MPRLLLSARASLLSTISLFVALLSGCEIFAPDPSHFSEPRYYTYDFFESYAECEAAQPYSDFWINCSQTAAFCPSGRVDLMLTDIMHRGSYTVVGRRLALRFPPNPEVESRVVFLLSADEQSLSIQPSGTLWTRKPDQEAQIAKITCS